MQKEVKQYIIVRRDLGMNAGKLAAQAGHACMKVFFDKMSSEPVISPHPGQNEVFMRYSFDANLEETIWIEGKFTKITKGVKSEAKLMDVYNKAKEAGLNVSLIKDAGIFGLEGENYTVVAVGPNYVDKCEPIVGKLRLLTDL